MHGGAIYYDIMSPKGLLNNTFVDNNASYGSNYGSYPFKLAAYYPSSMQEDDLSRLVSGAAITKSINIGIYDQEGQLVTYDSSSVAWLTSDDIQLQISGDNKKIAENGVYRFDSITFIASPLYTTNIKVISTALDQTKIQAVSQASSSKTMIFNFCRLLFGFAVQTMHSRRDPDIEQVCEML